MSKRIESIEREILPDLNPDLSWLDQTDEQMGEGFEARAAERKATYGEPGGWQMIGVRAKAEIVVNDICECVTSAGLWGIEDDSDESHIANVYVEELRQLCDMLRELGFAPITDIKPHAPELGENWPDE